MTLRPRSCALAAALTLSLFVSTGHAHTFEASRTALVAIEAEHVDVLVLYELGNSSESATVDALADANRDGRVAGVWEELALAQALLPRALTGLSVLVDGAAPTLHVVRAEFEPGARSGGPSVWQAAVLLRAALPGEVAEGCLDVALALARGSDAVHVHAEVAPSWQVAKSSATPPDAEGRAWSAELRGGGGARWCVARSGPEEGHAAP